MFNLKREMGKGMRKIIGLLLVGGLFIGGCSSGASQAELQELKKQVADLKAENEKLKDIPIMARTESEPVADNASSTNTVSAMPEIKLNQTIVEQDFAQVTIKKVEFTKRVIPPKPDSFYTYYQVKDKDIIYIHVVAAVKNIQTVDVDAENFMDVSARYNDKYDYTGFSTIEEAGGGNFTYTNIESIPPLKTRMMHFLIEVPVQVKAEKTPLTLTVTINGTKYLYRVR